MDDLTAALRAAHVHNLKQKYLDIIEDANTEYRRNEQDYAADARNAYITRRRGERELPQQLRAQGLSGGARQTVEQQLLREYRDTMSRLDAARGRYSEDYRAQVDKQRRLMEGAVSEYELRNALSDAGSAGSARSTSGRSSRKKSSATAADNKHVYLYAASKRPAKAQRLDSALDYLTTAYAAEILP